MRTMAVSVFKAHALAAVDRVAQTREGIILTKRGRPVVQVVPYQSVEGTQAPGRLAKSLVFEKDIVSPLGDDVRDASR